MLALIVAGDWLYFSNSILVKQPITMTFEKGQAVSTFIDRLKQQNIINAYQHFHLKILFRFTQIDKKLQAGEYAFPSGITLNLFLNKMIKGDSLIHKVTFIEGWTFSEIKAALDANIILKHTENLDKVFQLPEGRFFPDTYYFVRGMSDLEILERAKQKMDLILKDLWENRDLNIQIQSPYEGLILASLIEKESAYIKEYALIAGVFDQRLKQNMRLQCDPTIIYGLGSAYKGRLSSEALKFDTPYNTYMHRGLPPTPIAAPGFHALEAAFHPARTDAMYFVAKGDGSHTFSSTLAEHILAVKKLKEGKKHE